MSGRHKAWPKKEYPKPWTPKKVKPPPKSEAADAITDHAVIRYLERVLDIDVERVRRDLLADGREAMIREIGNGRLHTDDGTTLVIVGGKVVTVLRTEQVNLGATIHHGRT